MKGIYLTEEGKQELESQIYALEEYKDSDICKDPRDWSFVSGKQAIIKEILSSAIILPVEKSYNDIQHFETSEHGTIIRKHFLMSNYSTGIIIQPEN
jgi:hypothetical protein